jgi:hypothetical protein
MSIVGLATSKVARNARDLAGASAPQDPTPSSVTEALAAVAAYVPTEVLTAYTLTLALAVGNKPLSLSWYFAFVVLTPVFVWLVFAAKCREQNRPFLSWRLWPWWEAGAACVAFTAWSAALPQTAFQRFGWYSSGVAAVVLAVISGVLPLVGTVVTKTQTRRPQ